MDEGKASAQMLSVSENVSEDATKFKPINNNRTRICLVGDVGKDESTLQAANKFGVPVELTETGSQFVDDGTWENIFVLQEFGGPIYENIYQSEQRIVGPTALRQYAAKESGPALPANTRPLYTLAMAGFVICFTGFRKKEDLTRMMQLIHSMGGSIRKEMSTKVTHLIANCCDGEKYTYASTFRVPIMSEAWVQAVWDQRGDQAALAGNADMMVHKLKPFHNANVCFYGFPDDERLHMTDVLEKNGGRAVEMDDAACGYVVVDSADTLSLLTANAVASSLRPPPAPPCLSPSTSSFASPPPTKLSKSSCKSPPSRSFTSPRSCKSPPSRSFTSPRAAKSCMSTPSTSCTSPPPRNCTSPPSRTCVSPPPRACTSPPSRSFTSTLSKSYMSPPYPMKPSDLNGSFMDSTNSAQNRPNYFNLMTEDDFDAYYSTDKYTDKIIPCEPQDDFDAFYSTDKYTDKIIPCEPEVDCDAYYSTDKHTEKIIPCNSERFEAIEECADSNHNGLSTLNLNGTFVSLEPGVTADRDVDVFKTPTSTPRRRSANASPEVCARSEGRHSGRRRTMMRLASTFKTPTLTRNAHRKSMSHFDFFLHRNRKHRHKSLMANMSATNVDKGTNEASGSKHHKSHHKERLQSIKGYFTSIYNGKDSFDRSIELAEKCETDCAAQAVLDLTGTSPLGLIKSPRKHDFSPIPFDIDLADAVPDSGRSVDASPSARFNDNLSPLSPTLFDGGMESSSTPKRACHAVRRHPAPRPFESPSERPARREDDGSPSYHIPTELSPVPMDFQALTSRTNLAGGTERELQQLTNAPVVDESRVKSAFGGAHPRAVLVKAEWFWVTVQNEACADSTEYRFEDYLESALSPSLTHRPSLAGGTPASSRVARKRKRLLDGSAAVRRGTLHESPAVHKRRSSVSDAGLLSMSGSFLDATGDGNLSAATDEVEASTQAGDTPRKALTSRHHVFLELVQTETNYVDILHTIMTLFKGQLEDVAEGDEPLLSKAEMKIIFGNLPPIYDVHSKILAELRVNAVHWREDVSIGKILLKYNDSLVQAYPPFINYFETMREKLTKCDLDKPRFHAFLKVCQTRPECGRQSLQELLIRPVQRLPSISLLLNDLLKNTHKSNADHVCLEQALSGIKEVMTHINEDKRKTEGQLAMFETFHDIDNCPPDLISASRKFIARCDVIELSDGLSGRGDSLGLFVFSDTIVVCKKRSRTFNSLKSPSTANYKPNCKPYKLLKQLPLTYVKRLIDIREADECHNAFAWICRSNQELKERTLSFAVLDDETDKTAFLRSFAAHLSSLTCEHADTLLVSLEAHQLDVNTSDFVSGTLGKAFKFATRTRLKVGRAFSFNKTPSKLKRAVSTMIGSPFTSTTNLTPSSQLAQMRLASCSNLNEHITPKEEGTYVAPMSVQPTRKNKCGTQSLSMAALRRL